jgi:hypothetical protein
VVAALAMTAARFGLRRALAFLPRIAQAHQFASTLPATVGCCPWDGGRAARSWPGTCTGG